MGAGNGMGLACARAFAERGANLLLSDIDGPALKRVASEVEGIGLFCDVASEASVAVFAAEVQRSFSSLDLLINAAGRSYVRTLGTLRISRALLPLLKLDGGRKDIVNIAHMGAGARQGPFPYAASIRAFACLSDALAENVRGTNVVLTTVMPREDYCGTDDIAFDGAADDHVKVANSSRRWRCEISDADAFTAKLAAAVYAARTGQGDNLLARAADGTMGMRHGRRNRC